MPRCQKHYHKLAVACASWRGCATDVQLLQLFVAEWTRLKSGPQSRLKLTPSSITGRDPPLPATVSCALAHVHGEVCQLARVYHGCAVTSGMPHPEPLGAADFRRRGGCSDTKSATR